MDQAIDKRPGSPLAGSSKKPRLESKLGIIFDLEVDGILEYQIYLVDLDGDGDGAGGGIVDDFNRQISPVARVQVPFKDAICDLSAVCFLNSTLYIFEGFNPPERRSMDNPYKKRTKSAYMYSVDFSKELDIGVATRLSPMLHAKGDPVALPFPNGQKILVFSTKFRFKESDQAFELFDPNTRVWGPQVPPLPCPCANPDYKYWSRSRSSFCVCRYGEDELHTVITYSLIDESHLFLQLRFGAFVLDLNQLSWNTLYNPRIVDLEGHFETVMGRYALAPVRHMVIVPEIYYGSSYDAYAYDAYVRVVDFGDGGLLGPKDVRQRDASFRNMGSQLSILAPPYPEKSHRGAFSISILRPREEENGQFCTTCVVQVESQLLQSDGPVAEELGCRARVLIDVCCTDLATLKTNITKRLSVHDSYSHDCPFFRAFCFTV